MLFGQTFGSDAFDALGVAPAPRGTAVEDWQARFVAARDPLAAVPDISVEIGPSLAVPGAFRVRLREHLANAEQPFVLDVDGAVVKRAVASEFDGDVWAEARSRPDVDGLILEPVFAELGETVDVLDLSEHGVRLGLYQLVSHGEVIGPAVRYLRAQTSADVTAADVALTLPVGWPAVSPPAF